MLTLYLITKTTNLIKFVFTSGHSFDRSRRKISTVRQNQQRSWKHQEVFIILLLELLRMFEVRKELIRSVFRRELLMSYWPRTRIDQIGQEQKLW
jgi:hypothetical protein